MDVLSILLLEALAPSSICPGLLPAKKARAARCLALGIDLSSMSSSAFVSLLLVVVVAPHQPYGIDLSELGEEERPPFGIATLSMTVDTSTLWLGEVIDAVENKAQIPQLSFLGGKFERLLLERVSRFLQLVLLGPDGISTKLLFRFSDLYLIGFANQDDHWFVMEGEEDMMPDATVLPFGVAYKDLLEEIQGKTVEEKVANLALGRAPTLEAVVTLGTSDPSSLNAHAVASALGLFAVTVAESLRFLPVRAKIGEIFESGSVGYLDDKNYYNYMKNWVRVSMFLLCSLHGRPLGDRSGYAELVKVNIKTEQQAIDVIGIMVRPKCYNPDDIKASCDDI